MFVCFAIASMVRGDNSSFDMIFVSGGRRGLDIELAPADLISVVGGTFANVAR